MLLAAFGSAAHALGLHHQKLTYYFGGRNQQLTNFGGDPILKVFQA